MEAAEAGRRGGASRAQLTAWPWLPNWTRRRPWRGARLEGKIGLLLLGVLMAALAVAI
jgi:hypothetical protein